jgi:hypothetical protein
VELGERQGNLLKELYAFLRDPPNRKTSTSSAEMCARESATAIELSNEGRQLRAGAMLPDAYKRGTMCNRDKGN